MSESTVETVGTRINWLSPRLKYNLQKRLADYTHWLKMSYWTLDEGVALLLGTNPKYTNWDLVQKLFDQVDINPFPKYYSELRDIVLRAQEAKEITDPISPLTFVEWAESARVDVPAPLQEQAAIMKSIKAPVDTEKDELLQKIAMLENKITVLEASVWPGFDEKSSTYSKELAIAVKAHDAVSKKNWRKGSSVKKHIRYRALNKKTYLPTFAL